MTLVLRVVYLTLQVILLVQIGRAIRISTSRELGTKYISYLII